MARQTSGASSCLPGGPLGTCQIGPDHCPMVRSGRAEVNRHTAASDVEAFGL
jgi:hypothetical protein